MAGSRNKSVTRLGSGVNLEANRIDRPTFLTQTPCQSGQQLAHLALQPLIAEAELGHVVARRLWQVAGNEFGAA